MNSLDSRTTVWAAYANGVLGVLALVLLFIFFAVGEPFGTFNDLLTVLWAAASIPIMLGRYQAGEPNASPWKRIGLVVGLLGALGVIVVQILLVVGVMGFWQQQPFLYAAYSLIGLWLLSGSHATPAASDRLKWFGTALGVLWVVTPLIIWIGGLPTGGDMQTAFSKIGPITYVGFSTFFVAYLLQPFWALWLGRVLSRKMTAPNWNTAAAQPR